MKSNDLFNLKGKVAIITGGSIGLGAQMSIGLAEAGAIVVVAARKVERCVELCKLIEAETGVKALPVACDASKAEDCQNLIYVTVKEFGTVDILVNNAGITWGADAMDYPMNKWQQLLDVNLTGVFQLSVMAARVMKEKGRGKIVNISSTTGFGGTYPEQQDTIAYNVSKGAVITLTQDLGVKWARHGIYVNGIAPGPFVTHMTEKHFANVGEEQVKGANPMGRYGSEWDLKGAVVFLSSAASDFITGHVIPVDGGSNALA
ncbi:MAG: SDR family oxidoreductase [Syntrophomonadaceae bacterium]|nr:SDR family oxidoreductase [Syntrophomonadaceae bacterium]